MGLKSIPPPVFRNSRSKIFRRSSVPLKSIDDLIDFTPELRAEAIKIISQYRYGPLFTPPSLLDHPSGTKGTVLMPGTISNVWNGAAFDPPGTIPEPSTWMMMLLGFVGLGFFGYRASRKSVAVA